MAKKKRSDGETLGVVAGVVQPEHEEQLATAEAEQLNDEAGERWSVLPEVVAEIIGYVESCAAEGIDESLEAILNDPKANLGPRFIWDEKEEIWHLQEPGHEAPPLDFDPATGEAHEQHPVSDSALEQLAKVEYFKREIDVDLSSEERLAAACEWAKVCESQDLLKVEKADVMSAFKDRMGALNTKAADLRALVQRGKAKRSVDCVSYEDHRLGELVIKRRDTQEVIERRALTAQERQLTLDQGAELAAGAPGP